MTKKHKDEQTLTVACNEDSTMLSEAWRLLLLLQRSAITVVTANYCFTIAVVTASTVTAVAM